MKSFSQVSDAEYGFYGRLKAEFPSQVIVDITEVCNLACTHCPHPEFKASSHYGARYLEPVLNAKMVEEVRDAGKGRTQYIRYTSQGEPLIHPQGYEMIEYAVRKSGVFVTITTNGTILNEKRIRSLLDAGVHMIDISLDAFQPETYAKIRVNGNLAVTRQNVLNLIRWVRQTGSPTKVVVSFVEQERNRHESADFERYWTAEGVDSVVIRRLHSSAGATANIAKRLWAESKAVVRYPCLYPWERITLTPGGQLSYCPQDWVHGATVADYRHTTIAETWCGEYYARLRAAHLKPCFKAHSFCGQCPDWSQTRWPGVGRSYADLIQELKGGE